MPRINLFKKSRPNDTSADSSTEVTSDETKTEPSGSRISLIMSRTFMAKVWHAFTALPHNEHGRLDTPKAKVLTQSLASVMQISTAVIKDFVGSFPEELYKKGVEFNEFKQFLSTHLLTRVIIEDRDDELCFENEQETTEVDHDTSSETGVSKRPNRSPNETGGDKPEHPVAPVPATQAPKQAISWDLLDQVCWTLYSKQALSPRYNEEMSDKTLYSLWLWFTTFSDTDAAGVVTCPVVMDSDELNYWLQYLFGELLALDFHPLKFIETVRLSFTEVLDAILGLKAEWSIDKEELEFVIHEFKLEMIDGIVRKEFQSTRGFLYKGKRNLMKSQWKRRYCVLTLKTFSYYADENMLEKKGQIPLSQIMSADPYRDRNSKLTRYQLETNAALFILEAEDLRSRNQWIRDIRFAIRCSQRLVENVHILKAEKRKNDREELRRVQKLAEEEKRRFAQRIQETEEANLELNKQIKDVKSELEREEQQRLAEERAREEITNDLQSRLENVTLEMSSTMERIEREKEVQQQELEFERNRVAELQAMRYELEAALEEEQRLRREEEAVRRMQAELMEEQVKARERLEEMKTEQEQLLGQEIQKRADIQVELSDQKEMILRSEEQMKDFIQKLKDSETQKAELYKKMKDLEEKMKASQSMPFVSHRGAGAFPLSFFSKKGSND